MANKFKAALAKLDDALKDLTSLHVQTFTGTVNLGIGGPEEGEVPKDRFKTLKEALVVAEKESRVSLVAESLYKFDGDSYNFITDKKNVPESALEMHQKAVKAGLDTRVALLNLGKSILGL
ncbi:MAG: hypothetical protein GY765_38605 [bacterium]|nr:hypothetical protein [bacterium]